MQTGSSIYPHQTFSTTSTNQSIRAHVDYVNMTVRFHESMQVASTTINHSGAITSQFVARFASATHNATGSISPIVWGPITVDHFEVPQTRRSVLQRKRAVVRRSMAEIKAEELLRSCLSRSQDEELTKYGWFDVPVGDSTYRVKRGVAGNVFRLGDDGTEVERFCIHPSGVPAGDAMLAQKLLLEADERKFRSVANITTLR